MHWNREQFNCRSFFLENQPQVEIVPEQTQSNIADVVSEYVFLNHEEEAASKPSEEPSQVVSVNGDDTGEINGQVESQERQPQNGAEAYENLVKSLTECDGDYMKDISEDAQMDENFGLIDEGNILETFGFRESGLFQ